jgi:quercetin dioxygenase-like cupin family protein
VRCWNLKTIDAPAGMRDPVVLESKDDARAVLIKLDAGQELGDHQVKERAWIVVIEGSVEVATGGERQECGVGTLTMFEPNERHSVSSADGARILMLLAPWPGPGHFHPDQPAPAARA